MKSKPDSPIELANATIAKLLRRIVLVAFVCIFATNLAGWAVQAKAPWIGATLREDGDVVIAQAVDPAGPAGRAGLRTGDTVTSVCGEKADPVFFYADPDHISSWEGQDALFAFQARCMGPRIEVGWSGRGVRHAILDAEPTGWSRSARRGLGMMLVAWAFGLVCWRSWLGRDGIITRVNLAGGMCACLGLSQLGFFQSRDVSLDAHAFWWLLAVNYTGSQLVMFAATSLSLVLPNKLRRLQRHNWLVWIPWLVGLVQIVLHFGRFLSNPLWTTYVSGVGSMGIASAVFAYRFVFEKDALARSQIKWIALSFTLGLLPLAILTEIPLVLGAAPIVTERWTILFTGIIPLGFAFAITRYRLLDIGTFVDSFVVHLLVMLMLAIFEVSFWGWLEHRIMSDPTQYKAMAVATMLVVVFLYSPLRAWVARLLAKALGRSRPSAETAVEGLLDRAHLLGDAEKALEQTLGWVLRPGSVRWIRPGAGRDDALDALSGTRGSLGQELSHTFGSEAASLWVPVNGGGRTSALVLGPSGGQSWRRGDLELARLVARAAEPLLESQGLKQEREALQREMHDGLGNQLYGLALLSQDCEEVSLDKLRSRMERIQTTAQDAIDSLRTGLSVLSAPTGSFGPALGKLLLRSEGHLAGAGIRLESWVEDEVAELELDGRHAFAFLRTLQECLGNAARHSQAKMVSVNVGLPGRKLLAFIHDDGIGFDPKSVTQGLGLGHIHRRLFELGGSGTVISVPGEGTRVRLEMPLPSREDA